MTSQSGIPEIAAAARDDPAAFGIIYRRYVERVYRYVYHQVNNRDDAEGSLALRATRSEHFTASSGLICRSIKSMSPQRIKTTLSPR
jgi:hypothetical protein